MPDQCPGMNASDASIAAYYAQAAELAERYDDPALLQVYDPVLAYLPATGAGKFPLDVGGGSGCDAAWLANLDDIYTALEWRCLRLRQDQQVPEWTRLREPVASHSVATGAAPP